MLRKIPARFFAVVALALVSAAAAAQVRPDDGSPELVSAGADPVIRYPVAHNHAVAGQCLGWLYFARDKIRYEALSPGYQSHSFDFPRSSLNRAEQRRLGISMLGLSLKAMGMNYAEFKFRGQPFAFAFWITRRSVIESGKYTLNDNLGYKDLLDAANSFPATVAMVERSARINAPPAPPTLSLLDPFDALEGKVVEAASPFRLRGIATHPSGITSVTVNGIPAGLRVLAPQTTEFSVTEVPLAPGVNAIVIAATAADQSTAQATFRASRPEVKILEPAPGSEISGDTVKVRGEVTGMRDVQKLEVAGVPAGLRPRSPGVIEFEIASVPLKPGSNDLSGYAVSSSGARVEFTVAVRRAAATGPRPLTVDEVRKALSSGVPKARVQALVLEYGVDFNLTEMIEQQLRVDGADTGLLLAIAKAKK